MDPFKEKYFVFFVSAGRTGTMYFGQTLSKIVEETFSAHEPDVFTPRRGMADTWKKLKDFGVYHLLLGKLLGKTGIRNISQNYLSGKYDVEKVRDSLIAQRGKYYASIDKQLIIESYYAWYGCIPAIRKLYANYKIVALTREPKSWITSAMNTMSIFGGWDWVTLFGLNRLSPALINDKEYMEPWKHFDQFQKVCWTYKTQYEIIAREIQEGEHSIFIRFEDLFGSEDRYQNLRKLLERITTFGDKRFGYTVPEDVLEKKIHESKKTDFPQPDQWDDEMIDQYNRICGDIAVRLGYEG